MNIPKEHHLKCEGCGKTLDMRDPSILAHGWIEDGKIVCYDEIDSLFIKSKSWEQCAMD